MTTDFGMLAALGSMLAGALGLWMYWRMVREEIYLFRRKQSWLCGRELAPIRVMSTARPARPRR